MPVNLQFLPQEHIFFLFQCRVTILYIGALAKKAHKSRVEYCGHDSCSNVTLYRFNCCIYLPFSSSKVACDLNSTIME